MADPATVSSLIDQYIIRKGDITALNLNAILQAIVGLVSEGGSGPSVTAYLMAMENAQPGAAALIQSNLPPDPGDPLNILFNHVPFVSAGGPLETFFHQQTGLDMGLIRSAADGIVV